MNHHVSFGREDIHITEATNEYSIVLLSIHIPPAIRLRPTFPESWWRVGPEGDEKIHHDR